MKKHGLWIALLFSASILSAQYTDQGNFMIGATFGLSAANSTVSQTDDNGNSSVQNPTSTLFSISPSVGYFVFDNFAAGISMEYAFSQVRSSEGERNEDSNLLFGPFARYYLLFGDDMALFLEGSFGFGNTRNDIELGGQPQNIRTNIVAFGVGPGLTIFSTSSVGIEALCKYNYSRSSFDTTIGGLKSQTVTRTNQFDFSVGLRLYFGGLQKVGSSGGGGTRMF
jgi:hypothetical protein